MRRSCCIERNTCSIVCTIAVLGHFVVAFTELTPSKIMTNMDILCTTYNVHDLLKQMPTVLNSPVFAKFNNR